MQRALSKLSSVYEQDSALVTAALPSRVPRTSSQRTHSLGASPGGRSVGVCRCGLDAFPTCAAPLVGSNCCPPTLLTCIGVREECFDVDAFEAEAGRASAELGCPLLVPLAVQMQKAKAPSDADPSSASAPFGCFCTV